MRVYFEIDTRDWPIGINMMQVGLVMLFPLNIKALFKPIFQDITTIFVLETVSDE